MINLHHINQRYETALNTHPAKGTPTRKAYLALADSVADVRVLMAEIERLRARLDAVKDSAHVPHGPVGVLPDDADAAYMRHAAMNIRKGHKVGGSNVSSAVANLLDTVAKILGGEQ